MCVSIYDYIHACADAHGSQKKALGSLELELQEVMKYSTWVLGSELRSFVRANPTLTNTLNQ